MKKFFSSLVLFSFVLNNSLIMSPVLAANDLKIKTADGSSTVYGSVLKPSENRLKVKIPTSLLKAIRSQGVGRLTVSITKIATAGQQSSVYSIPSENITLIGKQLLIDLLPCLDTAGSTVTAGALADGTYSFQISAGSSQFSGSFDFKAPAVVVGTISTGNSGCNGGTNIVNSLSGKAISGAVALSSTCTFFNEVQVAKTIKSKGKKKRSLFQDAGTSSDGFVYVDPVTDTEQTVAELENVVVIEDQATGQSDVVEVSGPIDLVADAGGDTGVVVDAGTTQEYADAVDNADANNNGVIDTPAEVQALENDLSSPNNGSSSGSTTSSSTSSSGSASGPELKPIQDPKAICERLREGVGKLKDCKGSDCPKPPCFPDDLRAKLKEVCADLLALIPTVKCERPQAVCGLQGGPTSGQPGNTSGGKPPQGGSSGPVLPPPAPGNTSGQVMAAQTFGGTGSPNVQPPQDGQCEDFRPPQQPSICKLCNTAGPEGCTGPALKTITASDGTTMCVLPEVQCIPFTLLGKISPNAKFDGICLFGDGDLTLGEEDDKPKDPRTCEPFKFDPGLACSQFRPTCDVQGLTTVEAIKAFDPVCCKLPTQGQPGGSSTGQPPQGGTFQCPSGTVLCPNTKDFCVADKSKCPVIPTRLNTDQVNPGNSGCIRDRYCGFINSGKTLIDEELDKLINSCTPGSGQQPGGMSGGPDPACVETCKKGCTSADGVIDRACAESCVKETCKPTGGTSGGQTPCDPAKDPNCKPPTTSDCPQGQVKDTAGNCVSNISECLLCPDGKTCKDISGVKPCPGTTCPTGQFKCSDGSCKSTQNDCGGTACPQGQVKDPTSGQCKPGNGGTACSQGQTLCSDGKTCKASATECPQGGTQPVTCSQGQTLCSDGKTCKSNTAECPQSCPDGKKKCADGSCQTTCPQ